MFDDRQNLRQLGQKHVCTKMTKQVRSPSGITQVNGADALDQRGRHTDAGDAEGRYTKAAIDKPGIQHDIQQESQNQKVAKGACITLRSERCVEHEDEIEKRGAQKDRRNVAHVKGDAVTGGAQYLKELRRDRNPGSCCKKAEYDCQRQTLSDDMGSVFLVAGAKRIANQRRGPGAQPAGQPDDDEVNGKGQRQSRQSLLRKRAGIKGIHDLK